MSCIARLSSWLAVALLCVSVGCQSTGQSGSGALASVLIPNASETRIRLNLIDVFEGAKFEGKRKYGPEMVFERPGSFGDDLMRGGWLSGKTTERVRLRIVPEGAAAFRVECNAFVVQYAGDRTLEEEFRVHRSGSYKKLLDEVHRRTLAGMTGDPVPP